MCTLNMQTLFGHIVTFLFWKKLKENLIAVIRKCVYVQIVLTVRGTIRFGQYVWNVPLSTQSTEYNDTLYQMY